jgi:hypothetical protein
MPRFCVRGLATVRAAHGVSLRERRCTRSRQNPRAVRKDGLARLIRVCEYWRVDVHHHLVPLTRCTGIDLVMQRRLREQRERVRARTLAYDSSPRASASARSGRLLKARATRTLSRAAPRSSPTRQLSQWAQERKSLFPPATRVELANQVEETSGGSLQMRRPQRNLVAQSVQLRCGVRSEMYVAGISSEWPFMAGSLLPRPFHSTVHRVFRGA